MLFFCPCVPEGCLFIFTLWARPSVESVNELKESLFKTILHYFFQFDAPPSRKLH